MNLHILTTGHSFKLPKSCRTEIDVADAMLPALAVLSAVGASRGPAAARRLSQGGRTSVIVALSTPPPSRGAASAASLPTRDEIRRATFDEASRIGARLCAALEAASAGGCEPPAEFQTAMRHVFSASNGARGFFASYLTDPALPLAERPRVHAMLERALAEAPPDAQLALVRSLVMSTATWSTHRQLGQPELADACALTAARASRLLRRTRAERILPLLVELRSACSVGDDALAEGAPWEDEVLDDDEHADPAARADPGDAHAEGGADAPPSWAEALLAAHSYSAEQTLAMGAAVDRVIHQRLVDGDRSWRTLSALRPLLEGGAADVPADASAAAAAAAGQPPQPRPRRSGVLVHTHPNGLTELVLARGSQLNALDAGMLGQILDVATAAADDPSVRALLIRSEDERAFSAGGDVRCIAQLPSVSERACFLHLEYAALAAVAEVARRKPVVAIADGLALGAGLGLFLAANRRVLSGRASVGMPECLIGLCPDAGALHHFATHPPGFVGMYATLSGARLSAPDALYAGLATAHVPEPSVPALAEQLRRVEMRALDALLAALSEPLRAHSTLARVQARIDAIFGQPDLEQVGSAPPRAPRRPARATPRRAHRPAPRRPRAPRVPLPLRPPVAGAAGAQLLARRGAQARARGLGARRRRAAARVARVAGGVRGAAGDVRAGRARRVQARAERELRAALQPARVPAHRARAQPAADRRGRLCGGRAGEARCARARTRRASPRSRTAAQPPRRSPRAPPPPAGERKGSAARWKHTDVEAAAADKWVARLVELVDVAFDLDEKLAQRDEDVEGPTSPRGAADGAPQVQAGHDTPIVGGTGDDRRRSTIDGDAATDASADGGDDIAGGASDTDERGSEIDK